jgi:hypothetical protein
MGIFEDTEEKYIDEKIKEQNSEPMVASVKKVVEHTDSEDYSNFECDVITAGSRQHLRNVNVMTPGRGMIEVPRVGDTVIVAKLSGRGERHAIIGTLHTRQERAPLAKEGMVRYNRGNIYFEMDGEGEWIRLSHKNNDDDTSDDANVTIEIDDSGSEPIINISGGTVNLGDPSGTFKEVARKGDSVEVSDADSGTISGEITSGSSNVKSS